MKSLVLHSGGYGGGLIGGGRAVGNRLNIVKLTPREAVDSRPAIAAIIGTMTNTCSNEGGGKGFVMAGRRVLPGGLIQYILN